MKTTFSAALATCGLSQEDAAEYLGVSVGSIKDWSRPTSDAAPPRGVWDMMAALYARICYTANAVAERDNILTLDRKYMNRLEADDSTDPLPGSAATTAGAVSLLLAIGDLTMDNPNGDETLQEFLQFYFDQGGLPPNKTLEDCLADGEKGVSAARPAIVPLYAVPRRLGDGTREWDMLRADPAYDDRPPTAHAVEADITRHNGEVERDLVEVFRSKIEASAFLRAERAKFG